MKRIGSLALACALFPLVSVPASAAAPAVAGHLADFDGDGYGDLAVGVPGETIGGDWSAGAVTVLYGSASGVRATRAQQWHQAVPGIADTPEELDLFGLALADGDFDGDGYDDLAIGAAREDLGDAESAGLVHVLYGSATGLRVTGAESWHSGAFEVGGQPVQEGLFGRALAAGDVNGDGRDELVVGGEEQVWVLDGTAGGLAPGSRHASPTGTRSGYFGAQLAAGDFDGDGDDDVAVGAHGESQISGSGTTRQVPWAGRVWVFFGTPAGLGPTTSIDQDTPGVNGVAEYGDYFGRALEAGDFNGDGRTDLAVGSPGDSLPSSMDAGVVHVLPGSPAGPTGTGSQLWHQNVAGVPGAAEERRGAVDVFGSALAAGDFDADGRADLAVGAPWDEVGTVTSGGTVTVFHGTANLLTTARVRMWHQDVPGVAGTAEQHDYFGSTLAAGDFDGNGRGDLAIGVRGESATGHFGEGVVHVLPGTATGLGTTGSTLWHQNVAGVPGGNEDADRFGDELAA